MMQLRDAAGVVQVLQAMVQAQSLQSADNTKLAALVWAAHSSGDEDVTLYLI